MRPLSWGAHACVVAVVAMSSTSASAQLPPHRRARPARPSPPAAAVVAPPGTDSAPAAPPAPPPPPAATAPATPVAAVVPAAPLLAHVVPRARPKPKEPPPPAGPTPDVTLTLEAPTPRGTWTMRVTNRGDVPVRLVADARLLTLEVTPRSAPKAVRCELPVDMRPGDDVDRPLVLPPGRSYVEHFEPRLYCFGPRFLDALAQGSIVVGRLGWTTGNRWRAPFEVQSIAGVEPELAPLKEIVSPPIGLPDEPSVMLETASPPRPDDPDPMALTLRGPVSIDAPTPSGIGVTVTLHNAGKRPVVVRFRPETLRFEVTGPRGNVDCRWPLSPVAAMRELFTTVPGGGSTELGVLLDAYCPARTFEEPGLVMIRPQLDTRRASGADIGLRTFDGEVLAGAAVIVRLHQGSAPPRLQRPHLEPLPKPSEATAAPSASGTPLPPVPTPPTP